MLLYISNLYQKISKKDTKNKKLRSSKVNLKKSRQNTSNPSSGLISNQKS